MPRTAVLALAIGVALITLAYVTAWSVGGTPTWGVWAMIAGTALLMSGMLLLAARRPGLSAGRGRVAALFLLAVLLAGFGLPVLLPPESAASGLYLGLPLRAAIEVYGVGLLPALILPLVFAAGFREGGLDQESLDRLREECDRLRRRDGTSA